MCEIINDQTFDETSPPPPTGLRGGGGGVIECLNNYGIQEVCGGGGGGYVGEMWGVEQMGRVIYLKIFKFPGDNGNKILIPD